MLLLIQPNPTKDNFKNITRIFFFFFAVIRRLRENAILKDKLLEGTEVFRNSD